MEKPRGWSSSPETCVHIPALNFPGSVVFHSLSNFSEPLFPYLSERYEHLDLPQSLWRRNEMAEVKLSLLAEAGDIGCREKRWEPSSQPEAPGEQWTVRTRTVWKRSRWRDVRLPSAPALFFLFLPPCISSASLLSIMTLYGEMMPSESGQTQPCGYCLQPTLLYPGVYTLWREAQGCHVLKPKSWCTPEKFQAYVNGHKFLPSVPLGDTGWPFPWTGQYCCSVCYTAHGDQGGQHKV